MTAQELRFWSFDCISCTSCLVLSICPDGRAGYFVLVPYLQLRIRQSISLIKIYALRKQEKLIKAISNWILDISVYNRFWFLRCRVFSTGSFTLLGPHIHTISIPPPHLICPFFYLAISLKKKKPNYSYYLMVFFSVPLALAYTQCVQLFVLLYALGETKVLSGIGSHCKVWNKGMADLIYVSQGFPWLLSWGLYPLATVNTTRSEKIYSIANDSWYLWNGFKKTEDFPSGNLKEDQGDLQVVFVLKGSHNIWVGVVTMGTHT